MRLCVRGILIPLAMVAVFALLSPFVAMAQSVSGAITGTVTDSSGLIIVGAKVTLTSEQTGAVRTATTNETGTFTSTALPPGGYSLKVEATGFRAFQRTGLILSANERLSAGPIELSVGAVTENITVAAQGAAVQTNSGEQSALLTTDQMASMMVRGRDVVSLLKILPGVAWQTDQVALGGAFGTNTTATVGAPANFNQMNLDGLLSNDLGTPNVFSSSVSMDAIDEVKVLLNSYQAEYAGNGGAIVNVITKSGGRQYHGTGYWYKRHEMFNANDFFNNRSNIAKPVYRFNTLGGTLGGPIYIPGKFNKNKDKLFGFYSGEKWGILVPQPLQQVTTPTALERAGNFSQTLDLNGKLIPITDPLTKTPFPGNAIPSSRANKNGLSLLNILPLPNVTDRTITSGNYNYQFQESLDDPKRGQLFKIDYLPSPNDRISVKGTTWLATQLGYNVSSGASAWGLFKQCYCFTDSALTIGYTKVFSPTIVMEILAGARHSREKWLPDGGQDELNKVLRSGVGFTAGQWYPQSNGQGIIPRVTWGGVTNGANITYDDRFLTGAATSIFNLNDNVTIIRGGHTVKLGIAATRMRYYTAAHN